MMRSPRATVGIVHFGSAALLVLIGAALMSDLLPFNVGTPRIGAIALFGVAAIDALVAVSC